MPDRLSSRKRLFKEVGQMRKNIIVMAAAVLSLGLGATACTAAQARQVRQVPSGSQAACPRRAPAAPGPGLGHRASQLVRAGAVTATLCQYGPGQAPRELAFRGAASAGLAAVIDGAGPVTASARRCDRPKGQNGVSQYVIFGYRSGRPAAVRIAFTTCELAIAQAGHRTGVLPDPVSTDLFSLALLQPSRHGVAAPDLIGASFAGAQAKAQAARYSVVLGGAAIDKAVPFGRVIFAAPPAGVRLSPSARQVALVLAVRPEPACRPRQLALNYLGGEPGTGNDLGAMVLRDVSAKPCELAGPLTVTGLDSAGLRVTVTVKTPVTGPAILSPGATMDHAGRPAASALVEAISLIAEYRDDPKSPSGALCTPHWIVPASWSVGLPGGGHVSGPNASPGDPSKLVPSGGFVTCRGKFSVPAPANYY
jgi:hypothetical protein